MGPGKVNFSPDYSHHESPDIPSKSEIIEAQILSRKLFEEIYDHCEWAASGGQWYDNDRHSHNVKKELGDMFKHSFLLQTFFDEMISFAKEKEHTAKYNGFIEDIGVILLDEDCLVNALTLPQKLFLATKLRRDGENTTWMKNIIDSIQMHFENIISYGGCPNYKFKEKEIRIAIEGKTIVDILDLINLVEDMAALFGDIGSRNYELTPHLLEELQEIFPAPFVEYAIAAAQKKITARSQERELPLYSHELSKGVFWPLSDKDSAEAVYLEDIIKPKRALKPGEKLQKISADYVGVIDDMNKLVQLSHFEFSTHTQRSISIVKALLEKNHRIEGKDYCQYLLEVHQTVFLPQYGDEAFSKWAEIMPKYNVNKWRDFFSLCSQLSDQEKKDKNCLSTINDIRERVKINVTDEIQSNHEQGKFYDQLVDLGFFEFIQEFFKSGGPSKLQDQLRSLEPARSDRETLDFYDLEEISKDKRLSQFLQNPEEESMLLKHIMRPELRTQIEEDLQCSIREIPLRSQMQLLKYLSGQNRAQFDKLRSSLQKNPNRATDILSAFLVCVNDQGLAREILTLADRPEAQEIFILVSNMLEIIDEKQELFNQMSIESENGKSKAEQKIALAVLRRTVELIQEINSLPPGKDLVAHLQSAKIYQKETVAWGALFSAYVEAQKGKDSNPQAFAEIFKDINVDILPCGKLIKNKERGEMIKSENYTNPKSFNQKDYAMIVANLRKAYAEIDPEWLEYLIDNIPHDLNNPDVRFVLIRNTLDNQVIGLCKIKPDSEDGTYYFGTHYVNEEFQKGFGIGNYLQQIAQSQIPEGSKIVATVAVANPAMERHIEAHNGVGNKIVYESDAEHKSKELIKFTWNHQLKLASKDNHKYSQAMLKAVIEKGQGSGRPDVVHGPGANMISMKCDTSPTNNQDFLEKSRQYFSKGYVLSRIFYNQKRGKPDLSQTYAVFEKPQTEIKQADLDQAAE